MTLQGLTTTQWASAQAHGAAEEQASMAITTRGRTSVEYLFGMRKSCYLRSLDLATQLVTVVTVSITSYVINYQRVIHYSDAVYSVKQWCVLSVLYVAIAV